MPTFTALDPRTIAALRSGAPDANGQAAERAVSDGGGYPCRCCLRYIEAGQAMLLAAARPFPAAQPYAETGPIFLHAADCGRWEGEGVPPIVTSKDYLLKGYRADDRIAYGTGGVVDGARVAERAAEVLSDPAIAYVDMRSASAGCWQARIVRDG